MLLCKIFGMIFRNDCLLSTICVLNRQEANVRLSTAAHLLAESASPFLSMFFFKLPKSWMFGHIRLWPIFSMFWMRETCFDSFFSGLLSFSHFGGRKKGGFVSWTLAKVCYDVNDETLLCAIDYLIGSFLTS